MDWTFKGARLKAGVWARERKERAEERAVENADPAGVTVPLWLVNAAKFASWIATLSLMYFLWLYTLDIARDRSGAMHLTHVGQWVGNVQFWFPYIAGFALIAFGIPYVAKIAIPTFMSLTWRGNFWPKLWALIIALCVSLVVIAGTFTVQGDTLMERDREAAVAVEQVQQGRAVLEGRIAAKEAELRSMMENRNAYLAQAASVGAAEWQRSYIEQTAPDDPQRDRITRALGAARAADAVRAELGELRAQAATQTVSAAVQGEVTTERTSWIADTLGWLEGVRAILLSLVMDIVALMMPWIALRLEQARNRQMGVAGGIPQHPWMLEDKHTGGVRVNPANQRARDVAEAMMEGGADPRFAADMARSAASSGVTREAVYDAETGEELIHRKATWAKKPKKKGEKTQIEIPPGPPLPDETGVAEDGGNRMAMTPAGPIDLAALQPSDAPSGEPQQGDDPARAEDQAEGEAEPQVVHSEPLSDDVFEALATELPVDAPDLSDNADERGEPDQQSEHDGIVDETDPRSEPETRDERLLKAPAYVAAE